MKLASEFQKPEEKLRLALFETGPEGPELED
jgi:hypothetical protein